MRKGKNISKNKLLDIVPCSHRIIIPVYIPNEEDYYQDAFKIFKMCVLSVRKTATSLVKISVVSNGSAIAVNEKLLTLSNDGFIDELIIEKEAIGKINSILKALRTAEERLITITDADVLFLNNWEDEVLNVFEAFPKAGMVSPVPVFRTHLRYTSNIWLRYLFSNKLKFRAVKNPKALTRFANSIGWNYLSDKLKDVTLTLKVNNTIAVVGNAHFVGTYKREVFNLLPKTNAKYKLGGNSEHSYTDLPVIKSGGYKLATYDNFAYHMGNTIEPWMDEVFDKLEKKDKKHLDFTLLYKIKPSKICFFFTDKIIFKFFYLKMFKKICYRFKGLNKEQLENFTNSNYE